MLLRTRNFEKRKFLFFSTQRCRDLRCGVPESLEHVCKAQIWLSSNCNEHVDPLVIMLALFGNPKKLTNTLKQTKLEIPKVKNVLKSN